MCVIIYSPSDIQMYEISFISYINLFVRLDSLRLIMSKFSRASPSRSPFRSPPRLYETQRQVIIEEEMRLKSAIKAESDYRRINDQLALLQVKVRHTNDLEDKVESLIRQNNQLARDNDDLARELSQKRYELQRLRITAAQHHERESIRNGQLYQANKALELEIELIKKQRSEGNRLFESHIQKVERALDAKMIQLDATTLKCSELSKELQLTVIRFEQQKNRLKNIMTRTQHELQRQLQYTKQRQTSEKFSEIDILKRNHAAQLALLEDQISKLKLLNQVKAEQFESQLAENKILRKKHDEEVRKLNAQNDDLRGRMLKLEEINRSQVETIQVKYSDIHNQGTTNLKQQHGRQIKLLLDEIDKLKWLVSEKNAQIQNLVQDKKELRRALDEKQLQLGSEIQSLKNQKYAQQQKHAEDSQSQMVRINQLINKSLRDSESYHERVKQFRSKISNLESEINDKQNLIESHKKQTQMKTKQLNRTITQLSFNFEKVKRELSDSQQQRNKAESRHKQYQSKVQNQIKDLNKKLNETEVKLQETSDKLQRQTEDNRGNEDTLKIEVDSLKQTISLLQLRLSEEQSIHSEELKKFTTNMSEKFKNLQAAQKKTVENLQKGFNEQLETLNLRIQKLLREKEDISNQLRRYIQMYSSLQKYFKNPHDGLLYDEKSKDAIYKVLEKVSKSTIHIF